MVPNLEQRAGINSAFSISGSIRLRQRGPLGERRRRIRDEQLPQRRPQQQQRLLRSGQPLQLVNSSN